jgi:hypothetical protein
MCFCYVSILEEGIIAYFKALCHYSCEDIHRNYGNHCEFQQLQENQIQVS